MNTIKEFLGARISEDEDVARQSIDDHEPGFRWVGADDTADAQQVARWNPWRVLTSCLVKRLIIAAHRDNGRGVEHRPGSDALVASTCSTCGRSDHRAVAWPCYTLRVMALDWEEHPDYRGAWRPAGLPSGGRCA